MPAVNLLFSIFNMLDSIKLARRDNGEIYGFKSGN